MTFFLVSIQALSTIKAWKVIRLQRFRQILRGQDQGRLHSQVVYDNRSWVQGSKVQGSEL